MGKQQADIRDLRIDVFIGDDGRRYRATHVPNGVYAEADSAEEAADMVNAGLGAEA